jgi:6-pyruvoyltetrahydropterin/6-carboxytetrahydropterin synthase
MDGDNWREESVTAIEIDGRGTMNAAMAHFVSGHPKCGTLHGHNVSLSVRVEVERLDPMGFVIDFSALKKAMKDVLESIDHQGVLAAEKDVHPYKEIFGHQYLEVVNGEKHLFLPASEVHALDVPATTAEALSEWASDWIWALIPTKDKERIERMDVTFWETPNTGATHTTRRMMGGMSP